MKTTQQRLTCSLGVPCVLALAMTTPQVQAAEFSGYVRSGIGELRTAGAS